MIIQKTPSFAAQFRCQNNYGLDRSVCDEASQIATNNTEGKPGHVSWHPEFYGKKTEREGELKAVHCEVRHKPGSGGFEVAKIPVKASKANDPAALAAALKQGYENAQTAGDFRNGDRR